MQKQGDYHSIIDRLFVHSLYLTLCYRFVKFYLIVFVSPIEGLEKKEKGCRPFLSTIAVVIFVVIFLYIYLYFQYIPKMGIIELFLLVQVTKYALVKIRVCVESVIIQNLKSCC